MQATEKTGKCRGSLKPGGRCAENIVFGGNFDYAGVTYPGSEVKIHVCVRVLMQG